MQPLTVRSPGGDIQLIPGKPVDLPEPKARELLQKAGGRVRLVSLPPLEVMGKAHDAQDSIVAVRIESPIIGEFWFMLSETEVFDPADGLPIYRPAEIQALKGKQYELEALQAIHRVKVEMAGTIEGN